jgi:hypothetical protein
MLPICPVLATRVPRTRKIEILNVDQAQFVCQFSGAQTEGLRQSVG